MKSVVIALCLVLLAMTGAALAQTMDVPRDHWAYDAVQELADKGYVTGYPDGSFMGNRTLTRYEFATLVKRVLDNMESRISAVESRPVQTTTPAPVATPAPSEVSAADLQRIGSLVDEFKVELTVIGTRLDKVEAEVEEMKIKLGMVETIAADPEGAVETLKSDVSKLKRLSLSGYIQTRYDYFPDRVDADAKTVDYDGFNIRRARMKLTARPSDHTTGVLQLDMAGNKVGVKDAYIEYDADGSPTTGPTFVVGQMNWPFGYEVVYSSSRREVPERALWSRRFFPGERDRGLKVVYPFSKSWNAQLGVFDGTGVESVNTITAIQNSTTTIKSSSGVARDYDRHKDVVANLQYTGNSFDFGVSGYFGKGVWNKDRTDTDTSFDKLRYGMDARYYLNNITLKGEYVRAKGIDEANPANFDQTDWVDGWNAQVNYNLNPRNILVARYDTISIDPRQTAFGRRSAWNYGIVHWLDDRSRVKLFYQDNREKANPKDNNLWTAEWLMSY